MGFDWPDVSGALDKLSEETAELKAAIAGDGDPAEELGDLLFAAVNAARFLKVDPEDALQAASDKFAARFRRVEELADQRGQTMDKLSLAELDGLWNEVQQAETRA